MEEANLARWWAPRALWHLRMPPGERETARELDREQNRRLDPGADERIGLRKLWAVEFYTPRYIDKLIEASRRFRWHGGSGMFERPDMSEWLAQARERGHGWREVGSLGGGVGGEPNLVQLPAGVERLEGHLGVISHGLVTFVVAFTYEKEAAAAIDSALRRPRWTQSKRTAKGWGHHGPSGQKFNDIRRIRKERVQEATAWFREHAPGVFVSEGFAGVLPTCELLTFREATPFPPVEDRNSASVEYLQCLAVFFRGETVWSVRDKPGVKLRIPRGLPWEGPPNHLVLTAKESDWDGKGGLADEAVSSMLSWIGTTYLVQGFGDTTREIRYAVASSPVAGPGSAIKALRRSDCAELAPVMEELATGVRGPYGGLNRLMVNGQQGEERPIAKGLVKAVTEMSARQRDSYRDASAEMSQLCSLLLQRRMAWLTWLMAGLAVVELWEEGWSVLQMIGKHLGP